MTNILENSSQIQESQKIQLPAMGVITDAYGAKVWGRLPYQFTFSDRDSYMAWRQVWRDTYKEMSQTIRALKTNRNQALRTNQGNAGSLQWIVVRESRDASAMMLILQEAKQLSAKIKAQSLEIK